MSDDDLGFRAQQLIWLYSAHSAQMVSELAREGGRPPDKPEIRILLGNGPPSDMGFEPI